jgi:uncharacterized phage protein gp47/JayE
MAWSRPTFQTLRDRAQSDLTSALKAAGYDADASLPRSLLKIMAVVNAAGWHVMYGVLEYLVRQILPDQADDAYLARHAAIRAVARKPATQATGVFRFTGDDGTAIGEDVTLVRADGAEYLTTQFGTISGGVLDLAVEAVDAGTDGNGATTLTLASPIAGADSQATLQSGLDDGTDLETIEDWRARIIARIQFSPHAGATADYVAWAREVAGVIRAKAIPLARGAGTVDVYFLHSEGTGAVGIPTAPQIAEVQAHLDEVRPITADVLVRPPTTFDVDFTVASITPDTGPIRTAVAAEWDALFARKALSGETVYVSDYWAAALSASGVDAIDLTLPADTGTPGGAQVFIRGTVTWPT